MIGNSICILLYVHFVLFYTYDKIRVRGKFRSQDKRKRIMERNSKCDEKGKMP